jgi:hypothetical protein
MYSDPAAVCSSSPLPVHSENPFKEPEPAVVSVLVAEKDLPGHQVRTVDVVKRPVPLRDKKRVSSHQMSDMSSSSARAAPILLHQRMARSMILESDFDVCCHSIASADCGGGATAAVGPRKAGSVLSFTSVPSPYRGNAADPVVNSSSRVSLLSQAYGRLPPTALQEPSAVPPVKPVRTFRHDTAASAQTARAMGTSQNGGQNTWDHYIREDGCNFISDVQYFLLVFVILSYLNPTQYADCINAIMFT